MNNDDNLDLLDLDDDTSADALPDATPFMTPRSKKPWLLIGVGVLVIILASYIIFRTVSSDSSSSMEVDLDAPAVIVEGETVPAVELEPAQPVQVMQPVEAPVAAPAAAPVVVEKPVPAPVKAQPQPVVEQQVGVPTRMIEDRKDVQFKPQAAKKVEQKKAAQPAKKIEKKVAVQKTAKKSAPKAQVAPKGSWYVQFGSYSTRELAENAQKQIMAGHESLFAGKQFVILAAVLKNGTTTYRLRIAFSNSNDANSFCRNAKSDGLDCYVAK